MLRTPEWHREQAERCGQREGAIGVLLVTVPTLVYLVAFTVGRRSRVRVPSGVMNVL